ncbi:MAG TPA: alpha/beta hydrolase [Porphyromonadaceae bacterium]|jgi:pimeloyl-ACP methyl ester carboxylesterase|nr:alpha/beta hydrolase [Porphyromonadaceae bacterium]HBL35113.1 alpha/beta hydrolase [Porphyromonadaceae bacterium]HBX19301.1 alpha/beta hydrolase [Porphyromonadaceae bacterium]HCM20424.1 alpha/beta hydrolase [Porphyromonadaceae bacterium]
MRRKLFLSAFLGVFLCASAQTERPVLDIMLTNYDYPYDVGYLDFTSQQQNVKMAYMDVLPEHPNGKTIVLLHGKNFNGAYWKTTVAALVKEGYRVVVPDQIGFGKSSKPAGYQYTFQQLAGNTKAVLDKLGIQKVFLLGHSMGGMLAVRFAVMYPETVEKLILENPIGLEDWKLVAPYTSIDENYQKELKVSYETTKNYQSRFYYDNRWKPEYDEWVYLLTGWTKHPDYSRVAMNNAQTSDMIFTQPVVYEFSSIQAPTLLIIGTRDRTAIGKDNVKDEAVRERMGQYQLLGKETQRKIPGSRLVELDDIGHLPHIEAFDRFIEPLIGFLKTN